MPSGVIETDKVGEATVLEVDDGNLRFNAFGLTIEEVSIKNISNRNIISVMEAMLNSALILFLFLSAIEMEFEMVKCQGRFAFTWMAPEEDP